ncbi:TlpA family protein disulfide reductase [Pseudodesulfovibrio sp.]|uniref:TlpA family protein disulfide reductase n=1 Tax=unclassified Pseudodesulfovibrio TaxID=2661612 RepID=UPI003AFFA7B8
MLQRSILSLFMAISLLCLAGVPAGAADAFPDLPLTGPLDEEQKEYLGLSDEARPSAIGARYLFIELFSMYCPICQRNAPKVNALYQKVSSAGFGKNVRFIGIGAGNTAFEVKVYGEKFGVAFPLFDDPNYVWHKALGEVGTPTFYLVDMQEGRTVRYRHEGAIDDVNVLLALIKGFATP